jgi:RNA polymerase sigma-70 factor (ECF subfamily)
VTESRVDAAAGATEEFLRHRPLLFGIAYRMLGSAADAEDAVQETWLRWSQAGEAARSPRAWLSTTVTRLCIDQLRSARARREEYVGPWLPEPLVGAVEIGPADGPLREESLSTAFLLLLESLSPTERAVFLLREVFGFDYPQIARAVEKSEAACRQLLHRARERLADGRARYEAPAGRARELAQIFVQACATGDLDALLAVLADDVVAVGDGGGVVPAGMRPVLGADKVSRLYLGLAAKFGTLGEVGFAEVNGAPGVVLYRDGTPYAAVSFEFRGGRIAGVYSVNNPHKLGRVPPLEALPPG